MISSVRDVALRAGHLAIRILLLHEGREVRGLVRASTTTDQNSRDESDQPDEHELRDTPTPGRKHARTRERPEILSHAGIISQRGHIAASIVLWTLKRG